MPLLTRAVTLAGRRFELQSLDTNAEDVARRHATRAAELLAAFGRPQLWAWSHVVVVEAFTGRLLFVAHIQTKEQAR